MLLTLLIQGKFNSDCQQFHQYQNNEQLYLTSNHCGPGWLNDLGSLIT